ncbi:MAG: flagellar assembly protein FliW [Desulfarculus sp.]|nr:flagellar assembly protein FliW [Desulfarculus sp.]
MPEKQGQASLTMETTRFGQIEVPDERVITLPHGMVGFPRLTRYVILEHRPGSPFHWLQSLDRGDLAFVIMDPLVFDPHYQLALGDNDAKLLQVGDVRHIQVWVVVTIPQGTPENMTANFKAPLVINLQSRLAAQIILEDPRWSVRQSLKK